ncbi:hypothetical protein BKA70DRAFT_1217527 [Coprinopsis sp. MPI-PUGE-AT-0042]|nr:hypothetical protein BKA70DRAFT_1217527 [Coprinopsis sp. MPI-PUGE-AT-0042]
MHFSGLFASLVLASSALLVSAQTAVLPWGQCGGLGILIMLVQLMLSALRDGTAKIIILAAQLIDGSPLKHSTGTVFPTRNLQRPPPASCTGPHYRYGLQGHSSVPNTIQDSERPDLNYQSTLSALKGTFATIPTLVAHVNTRFSEYYWQCIPNPKPTSTTEDPAPTVPIN